ncbi:hypothetical protein XELAEV_18009993mg [Xenopus laevis]|uniref:Uncharacterized protein n=1 Tax=Xenopus laevis TaxID=8355 RepID=A0A974DTB9_XENLA|nr:hypothetical protein XELAEV_18009993mg [Xenopus laevis]
MLVQFREGEGSPGLLHFILGYCSLLINKWRAGVELRGVRWVQILREADDPIHHKNCYWKGGWGDPDAHLVLGPRNY